MNQKILSNRPLAPLARSPFSGLLSRDLWEDFFDQMIGDGNGKFSQMMNVSMDVAETDQAFEIKIDLPGIRAEDVDIQIDNNTLTIRGHRNEESEETAEEKRYHRIERYAGSFSRSLVLPTSVNEDETAAEFKDGVLEIVVPKTNDAKPRKINISN